MSGARGRIYKNGSAFGSEQYTNKVTYRTFSEDLSVDMVTGETLELWIRTVAVNAKARRFRIYYDSVCDCDPLCGGSACGVDEICVDDGGVVCKDCGALGFDCDEHSGLCGNSIKCGDGDGDGVNDGNCTGANTSCECVLSSCTDCTLTGDVCFGAACRTPKTCADFECGVNDDGCGGWTADCGDCSTKDTSCGYGICYADEKPAWSCNAAGRCEYVCNTDIACGHVSGAGPTWLGRPIVDRVNELTLFLLKITGGVFLLMFVLGGIYYAVSGSNPDGQKKAKKMVTYAIFGLALILGSYILIGTISDIFTGEKVSIKNAAVTPTSGLPGTIFTITAAITAGAGVNPATTIAHIQNPDETDIAAVTLFDDGAHSDGAAGDDVYGNTWNSGAAPIGPYFIDINACDMDGNCTEAENI